jgi:hypothetical protein
MENVLEQLLSLSTIVLCLIISVLVEVQRKIATRIRPSLKDSKTWNEFWVPLGPLGTGALIGLFIEQYPWPADFTSTWGRVFFGVVCGLASAHVYRVVKKFLVKKEDNMGDKEVESLMNPKQ